MVRRRRAAAAAQVTTDRPTDPTSAAGKPGCWQVGCAAAAAAAAAMVSRQSHRTEQKRGEEVTQLASWLRVDRIGEGSGRARTAGSLARSLARPSVRSRTLPTFHPSYRPFPWPASYRVSLPALVGRGRARAPHTRTTLDFHLFGRHRRLLAPSLPVPSLPSTVRVRVRVHSLDQADRLLYFPTPLSHLTDRQIRESLTETTDCIACPANQRSFVIQ